MTVTPPPEAAETTEHTLSASSPRGKKVYPLIAVLGTGLLFRLLAAWAPITTLVQKTLPDDAFYYFAIAQNVWNGSGVSVDGLTQTNGFHPLWALLILPIYGIFRSGDLPIHIVLSLAAVLELGTAWLSYRSVQHLTGSTKAGALAAALIYLNPLVAMESLNGLETALSLFCAALTFYVVVRCILSATVVATRCWAALGGAIGIMLLARTDNVLLAVCLGLYVLWLRRQRLGATIAGLARSAVVAGLLLLPWLYWNQSTFGSIVQSSAVAAPAVFRRALWQPLSQGVPLIQIWQEGLWPVVYLSLLLAFRYAGVAWTALAVGILLQRLVCHKWPSAARHSQWLSPLLVPGVAALLLLVVHTFVRWYPRSWYFVPLAWASALVAGAGLARLSERLGECHGRHIIPRVGAALVVLLLGLQGIKSWQAGFYPWQGYMLDGARWVAAETLPDTVVASFNSGLQAYYGERQIVNLDGVVNWDAARAMENRSLFDYAASMDVEYMVDYEAYIFGQYGPYLGIDGAACLEQQAVLSPEYPPYGAVKAYTLHPDCTD